MRGLGDFAALYSLYIPYSPCLGSHAGVMIFQGKPKHRPIYHPTFSKSMIGAAAQLYPVDDDDDEERDGGDEAWPPPHTKQKYKISSLRTLDFVTTSTIR